MSRDPHAGGFEHVTAQWLAARLREIQRAVTWATIVDSEGDETGLDVRLQVADGDAIAHYGDPGFDTDHRGYWGSGVIASYDDWSELLATAQDMIDQARNQQVDSQLDD